MKEKEVKAQYEIISKMSFSEILELITRGCDYPIYSRNLKQGDTIVYVSSPGSKGFGSWPIESVVTPIKGGLGDGATKELSFFIVSKITEPSALSNYIADIEGNLPISDRKEMQYWMYQIRFVGDALFKELYTLEATAENVSKRMIMIDKIDRPTIVFNVITGDRWICDRKHPKYGSKGIGYFPPLKFHSGNHSVFDNIQIVIVNPIILSHYFLNWNSNPFEVKR